MKDFVNKIITTPFIEGGRDYSGCDCWGLILLAYRDVLGVEIPNYENVFYSGQESLVSVSEEIEQIKSCQSVFREVVNPQKGDIVFFNMLGRPIHVGFVIDEKTMIHTSKTSGVAIENYRSPKWSKRLQAFYRHKTM